MGAIEEAAVLRGRLRTPQRRAWLDRATARARDFLRPGDRVTRTKCGGSRGTFRFTGWDGDWACGVTTSDCAAVNIVAVNGRPVDFTAGEPDPFQESSDG